ncbi:MAG: hypothetical protein JJU37_17125 [Balneolaceae bacterium]|nr:hypothetical protein [Balneolaceae bacterium]
MNIWIARLGEIAFTKQNLNALSNSISGHLESQQNITYRYQAKAVDYVSFCPDLDKSDQTYHNQTDHLLGYSGLLVGNGSKNIDLRNAVNIDNAISSLHDATEFATGQFALFRAFDGNFECIVDSLGSYKVFYLTTPEATFVTNFPKFLQLFKKHEANIEFYIHYIASAGSYGNETDEKNVFRLTDYGRLQWDQSNGLSISQYKSIADHVNNNESYEDLLKSAATSMRGASEYLSNYHQSVLSMSGGYDSRLILRSFWGLSTDAIKCFSFPDNEQDVKLAKSATKDQGINHITLSNSSLPTFQEMFKYSEKILQPFRNFDNILGYTFEKDFKSKFENDQYVLLNGNGGDIDDYGIKKFKHFNGTEGTKLIGTVIHKIVDKDILTPDGYEQIFKNLKTHYESKYEPFCADSGNEQKLRLFYFIFERFGNYQGYKFFLNYFDKNYFLPFGNDDFIRLVLNKNRRELPRLSKNSLHKDLTDIFTDKQDKAIPFTGSLHWDASLRIRIQEKLKTKVKSKFGKLFNNSPVKQSSLLRSDFYNQNLDRYLDIIHSSANSPLWYYLDKDKIIAQLQKSNFEYKNGGDLLSKIAPLLYSDTLN